MKKYLEIKPYNKEFPYYDLNCNDILCIIDPNCIDEEIFFPVIIKREFGKLIEIVNEGINENVYELNNNEHLIRLKNHEKYDLINKSYYFILNGNNDINEIIRYFNNIFVFGYIRDNLCDGKIKLNKLKIPLTILPSTFTKILTDKYISYCEQNYHNDNNINIANKLTKRGIYTALGIALFDKLIPDNITTELYKLIIEAIKNYV